MSIKLHKAGLEQAEKMIREEVEVDHFADDWDIVKPEVDDELAFLDAHSMDEYGQWFLGVDSRLPENDRARFVYPYGDFFEVQVCALLAAQAEAKQNKHDEIAAAAEALLKKIEEIK